MATQIGPEKSGLTSVLTRLEACLGDLDSLGAPHPAALLDSSISALRKELAEIGVASTTEYPGASFHPALTLVSSD